MTNTVFMSHLVLFCFYDLDMWESGNIFSKFTKQKLFLRAHIKKCKTLNFCEVALKNGSEFKKTVGTAENNLLDSDF